MSDVSGDAESFVDGEALTASDRARALRDGVLLGQICQDCGHGTAAAAAACTRCSSRELDVVVLPQEGDVHSETLINVAPPGFEAPYTIAIVEVDDGVRLTAHIDGTVDIGDTVSLVGVVDSDDSPAPLFE